MTIRIGTSERDGTFYSQGRALKILFERRPALAPVEVLASNSASMENALRLDAGARSEAPEIDGRDLAALLEECGDDVLGVRLGPPLVLFFRPAHHGNTKYSPVRVLSN